MTAAEPSPRRRILTLLRSSAFASAFATAAIGALFSTHLLRQLMGDAGYGAIIVGLCVIGLTLLVARRREWRVIELMPTTLVLLLAWLLVTTVWSVSVSASLTGWLQLAAPTLLAVVVAQFRDTLQTVRATGDVLRFLLSGSLAIEIFSGILIDLPIPFLGIGGHIAEGGPIQGLFGSRTLLGLVTIIALITFLVEWRTRSVPVGVSVYSVLLGLTLALLTASPLVLGMGFIAGLATAILALVRHTPARHRTTLQWTIAGILTVSAALVYVFRRPFVYWLNAEPDFLSRTQLWNEIIDMAAFRPVQGWGWVGTWPDREVPYSFIQYAVGYEYTSALNAWMDMLLQAGAVGVALFAGFAGLALARAWLTASERRSTVYTWPTLIIVTLLVDSAVTSSLLGGFGWFLLVFCATRSSVTRSWRTAFEERPGSALAS